MIDPQDNDQFKKDIALRIAKMKERRWGNSNQFRDTTKKADSLEETAREIFASVGVTDENQRLAKDMLEAFPELDIVDVEVKVPLIKNSRPYFNLNRKFIEKCERQGKLMRLNWPDGSALHKPEEWLKTGTPYQKEFKFAGNPMEMVGNFLDLEE